MITFVRVNNDINGNPRYVCHFSDLLNKNEYASALNKVSIDEAYNLALKKAKKTSNNMKRTKIVKRTEQVCRVYGNRVYFFSK